MVPLLGLITSGCSPSTPDAADAADGISKGRDVLVDGDEVDSGFSGFRGFDSDGCVHSRDVPAPTACDHGMKICPDAPPNLGDPCPPSAKTLQCTYGSAADWGCRSYFICDECSQRWVRPISFACEIPGECSPLATDDDRCEGGVCNLPRDGGPYCRATVPDSGCPPQMPDDGECCQSPAACNYLIFTGGGLSTGGVQEMLCGDGGAWSIAFPAFR
jgi:hypothetical protein